ncbi:helix-turn-helix domain-containing protein [Streptomyces sp. PR69]|uniref:helix-turn-helix domain-containing protein n=1 Tax=Streptomyces sp. PR69 TaxID=2984950 RepID=UPI002B27A084|nr:LuxR C-terminal-related transcriptional regulator [Streptomyces sp. PR69]
MTTRDASDLSAAGLHNALYRGAQPVAPGNPNGVASLTDREKQVLVLLGSAAGNRSIARTLGIAERTVKAHLTNLMSKIGVASRIEAAIFAFAHHELLRSADLCPCGPYPKVQ